MVSRKIVIVNPTGLHVRPAGILSNAAEQCSSKIELIRDDNIINCRSLLNILSAAVRCGDELELQCTGPDEEKDLAYMMSVIRDRLEPAE